MPPIILTAPKQKKPSRLARALDIISAPLSKPRVTFTKGLGAGATAVQRSRERISRGDRREALKVVGTTVLSTATVAAATGAAAAPAAASRVLLSGGKIVAGAAVRNPIKTTLIAGLATTQGGRSLITGAFEKSFRGGQIIGDIAGGKDPNLTPAEALTIGGLGAGAVVAGKQFLENRKDNLKVPKAVSSVIAPIPASITESSAVVGEPTSAPVVVEDTPPVPVETKKEKPINIKIQNDPQINIAIAH